MTTLEEITSIHAHIERCFDLARSVEVHLAGNVHWGEQAIAAGGVTSGLMELGQQVQWRARHFGVRHTLTTAISALERPAYFQDVRIAGIFPSMRHDHYFRTVSGGTTEMRDVFTFSAPLAVLGRIAEIAFLARYMRRLLRERNAAIRTIAESSEWRKYLS